MNNEEILGVFSAMYAEDIKLSSLKGWICDLYFTSERMVVIEKPGIRGRLEANKGIHPLYIQELASARERLKMNDTPLDDMCNSNARNFSIPYEDIAVIDFGKYGLKLVQQYLILNIYFSNNIDDPEYRFLFKLLSKYHQSFHDFLSSILPGKV